MDQYKEGSFNFFSSYYSLNLQILIFFYAIGASWLCDLLQTSENKQFGVVFLSAIMCVLFFFSEKCFSLNFRLCTRAMQMKHQQGFSTLGTGMLPKPIKWLVRSVMFSKKKLVGISAKFLNALSITRVLIFVYLYFADSLIFKLLQLIDCIHWRVENEIDKVLEVSSLIMELLSDFICFSGYLFMKLLCRICHSVTS